VDHVDTEYCLRARRQGLTVYLHGDFEFAQSIGQRRTYQLLGRRFQSGGHSSARRWGIGRNLALLALSSISREPAFAMLCALRLVYEAIGIVLVEQERLPKLSALARGALAGLRSR
jgi:rhamnosyltransferase